MATLVIPDHLYVHLKQSALAHQRSWTEEAVMLLEQLFSLKHVENSNHSESLFTKRRLLPEYVTAFNEGVFSRATESIDTIIEEPSAAEKASSFGSRFANRKLLPGYAASQKEGAFIPRPGDRDITDLISEDRDGW